MALGFWSGSALLAIAGTGIAMAYSGTAKPRGAKEARGTQEVRGSPGARSDGGRVEEAAWDSAYALAKARLPGWRTLAIRKPRDPDGPLTALIEREGFLRFPLRSRLEVDARTGRERKWEPYSAKGWGGGWRAWMVPLHTGRGFGWAGQAVAGLASGSLLLLIATGARLAWRRRRPR